MGLFKKKKTEVPVKTLEQELAEKQQMTLEMLKDELNKQFAGKSFDFGTSDYKSYIEDAVEYVETNSELTVTNIEFGADRIMRLTLEPKPRRFAIEIETEEVEEDGE